MSGRWRTSSEGSVTGISSGSAELGELEVGRREIRGQLAREHGERVARRRELLA
jgi:hypothetical protein